MSKNKTAQAASAPASAATAEEPKHLHVKIEEAKLPQIYEAIGHICADVNGGTVSVRRGRNGDQSREVQKAFIDLRVATSSRDSETTGRLLTQIVRSLRDDRVTFQSSDGAARGRIIHLKDIKLRFQQLISSGDQGSGRVSGAVDVRPAMASAARV